MSRPGATVAVVAVQPDDDAPEATPQDVRHALAGALRTAAQAVGVPQARLHPVDTPHGMSLVVDGSVPAHIVAGRLLTEWDGALTTMTPVVRCRVGMHRGLVAVTGTGWHGEAVDTARSLARTPLLRASLMAAHRARIALVVSDDFHRDVVVPGPRGLDPSAFARVTTVDGTEAWIRVLGYSWPPGLAESGEPPMADEPRQHRSDGTPGNVFNGPVHVSGSWIDRDQVNVYYGSRTSGDG